MQEEPANSNKYNRQVDQKILVLLKVGAVREAEPALNRTVYVHGTFSSQLATVASM